MQEAPKKVTRIESLRKLFQISPENASQKNQNPNDKKKLPEMKLFDNKLENAHHKSSKKDNIAIQSTSKNSSPMRAQSFLRKKEKINSTMSNFPEQTRAIDFILENQDNHRADNVKENEKSKNIIFSRSNSENNRLV